MMRKLLMLMVVAAGLALTATANGVTLIPRYEMQAGGHATGAGTYHAKLYRADGSLYASRDRSGLTLDTRFYNTKGKWVSGVMADMPSGAPGSPPTAGSAAMSYKHIDSSCGLLQYADLGFSIKAGTTWYWYWNSDSVVNTAPIHGASSTTDVLNAARNGRAEWNANWNWCGYADNSAVSFQYVGDHAAHAGAEDLYSEWAIENDTWMTAIGCGHAVALACAPYWLNGDGTVGESDVAINGYYQWGVNGVTGPNGAFDIWGITAHETGHNMGLGHVSSTTNIMSSNGCDDYWCVSNRKLGKGDSYYNNLKY